MCSANLDKEAVCEDGRHGNEEEVESRVSVQWHFHRWACIGGTGGTDIIGDISFNKSETWFATGGIARKVRLYSLQTIRDAVQQPTNSSAASQDKDEEEEEEVEAADQRRFKRRRSGRQKLEHDVCCGKIICTPARLSSVQWVEERVIGCGDYDGVVTEWDVERGNLLLERDGHGGKKIWSLDYSLHEPRLCASASDDGTVRLWTPDTERPNTTITPPSSAAVCSARFSHSSPFSLALACSDSNLFVFDLRRLSSPTLSLSHHRRAASNVRFLGLNHLVSASVDSTLQLWDLTSARPLRTFSAHRNVRNFVGLSVRHESGLLACGSETNQTYVYDRRWAVPMLSHSVMDVSAPSSSAFSATSSSCSASDARIVSAVCWKQDPSDCTLIAANSDGFLEILDAYPTDL